MHLITIALSVSVLTVVQCTSSIMLPSNADNLTNIDVILYSGPADGSEKVILTNPMYMLGVPIDTIFVAENGVIGLNEACEYYAPDVMPPKSYCYNNPFIAPYWADVDVTSGTNPDGYISYYILTTSGPGNNMINTLIVPALRDIAHNADIDSALVVTWYNVAFATFYSGVPTNTFQVVIASSSRYRKSYVMFNYEKLTWTGGLFTNSDMYTGLGGNTMPVIGITTGNPTNYMQLEHSGTSNVLNNTDKLSSNIEKSENPPAGRWLHPTDLFPQKILLGRTRIQSYATTPHCHVAGDPHVIMFDYDDYRWNPQLAAGAGPALLAAPCKYDVTMGTYHWSIWFKTYKPSDYSLVNQVFVKFVSGLDIVTVTIDGTQSYYSNNVVSVERSMGGRMFTQNIFSLLREPREFTCCDSHSPEISIKYSNRYVTIAYKDQMSVVVFLGSAPMLEPIDVYINKYGSPSYKCNMAGLCGNMNGIQDEVKPFGYQYQFLCIDDRNSCGVVKPGLIWPYTECENNCWSRNDIFVNPGPIFRSSTNNLCPVANPSGNCRAVAVDQSDLQSVNFNSVGDISASCSHVIDNACAPLLDTAGPLGEFVIAGTVTAQSLYQSCIADLCMMDIEDADIEACNYFEQAINLIKRDNILLQELTWRTNRFCAKSCPERMHYEACGSSCPITCSDRTSYFACAKGCQEGCVCDNGLVVNGDACTDASQCGCTDVLGYFHTLNSTWIGSSCNQVCSCVSAFTSECKTVPSCDPNASCHLNDADNDQSILCQCRAGFSGDGYTCSIDPCSSYPCQDNSTCTNTPFGGFKCSCPLSLTGQYCETTIDHCATSQRCMNGATCLNTETGYSCTCPAGFSGPLCQFMVNHCQDSRCQQGSCISDPIGYHCDCVSWYTGQYCDTLIDHCLSDPCLNGGECSFSPFTSYSCNCTTNAFGFNCDKLITPPPATGLTTIPTTTMTVPQTTTTIPTTTTASPQTTSSTITVPQTAYPTSPQTTTTSTSTVPQTTYTTIPTTTTTFPQTTTSTVTVPQTTYRTIPTTTTTAPQTTTTRSWTTRQPTTTRTTLPWWPTTTWVPETQSTGLPSSVMITTTTTAAPTTTSTIFATDFTTVRPISTTVPVTTTLTTEGSPGSEINTVPTIYTTMGPETTTTEMPNTSEIITPASEGSTSTPDCSGNQFNCYGVPNGNYAIPNCQCASDYITCSNNFRYIMPCAAGTYYNAGTDQCSACLI